MRPWEWARDLYSDEDRVKQKECEPVSTDECATERKIVIVHRERGAVKSWGIICSSATPCVCLAMATSSFVGNDSESSCLLHIYGIKQRRLALDKNRFRNQFIYLMPFLITPSLLYDLRNKWSVPYTKKQCPRTKMPRKIGGPIQYYHLSPRTHTATCRLFGESSSPHPRHD
ncbi:hypothetical protein NPIL_185141 [Nephila pilipes]|uniref:Uncharacterized protein n=1 Tax=Nephila pilipes TaxID=299642 RepID=A0A8X6UE09_NEPPI|nr:hypothetical protein NPIL_185141 [Nephila pilipes]